MIERVGLVALGTSMGSDELQEITGRLPAGVEVVTVGALDGLSGIEIRALAPAEDEKLLVCKVHGGEPAPVAYQRMVPRVQGCIDWLESEGAELITVLCGTDWTTLKSNRLLVNPGGILPQIASTVSRGRKLGIVLPTPLQIEGTEARYRALGADPVGTAIEFCDSPEETAAATGRAARFLVERGVDLVWMPCLGMGRHSAATMRHHTGRPVLLGQSLLVGVLNELIG